MAGQHNPVTPYTVSGRTTFTNPTANPTAVLNCAGRDTFEFYVSEPTGGKSVYVYGSLDNITWRLTFTYTTNGAGTRTDVMETGYQFVKVEIDNTAAGSYIIEMSATE